MLRIILAAIWVTMMTPPALAGTDKTGSAEQIISATAQDIIEADRDRLAEAVLERMDIRAIARFTLGRHAKSIEADKVDQYSNAFEAYLRRQIETNADRLQGLSMTVTKTVHRNERDAIVTTVVDAGGERMTLRWRMLLRNAEWQVVDLEFAGIWLAIEQRAQISAILDRPGADIDDVIAQFARG
ncbi:MAG: ABC transporter substrate-binding protein [Henriciella sp.]|nr:ABC transporter substrate-binding protein [Henriciella sp.]